MTRRSAVRMAPLTLLTALLASCGSQGPVASTNAALVSLRLDGGALRDAEVNAATLRPQGVPFYDDGTSAVKVVFVEVYRNYFDGAPDRPLWFDENGVESEYGVGSQVISLTPASSITTLRLRPGTYTLKAVGISDYTTPTALAYQQVDDLTLSPAATEPTSVTFHLKTVIGQVSLEPVLPVNYVIPGQTLDLKLVVQTPEIAGGKRFAVPLDDFSFSTSVGSETHGVEVQSASQLGERVHITAPQPQDTEVFLMQTVQGHADASKVIATFRPTFSRPYYPALTLGVDLARPMLEVLPIAYRGTSQLAINLSDNVGIDRLEVYEGVELVATTHHPNDPYVDFGDYGFGDLGYLADPTVPHDFVVVARDTSGNETRVPIHLNVVPPYNPPGQEP